MAKILIIEDEEVLLLTLESKLKKEGYDVITARNGEDGLDLIKKESPDLVLLDIVMPKMTGMEMMEKLKRNESIVAPLIVVISNSGQPVELEELKRLGASDWLIKTNFNPQELVEKVRTLLGENLNENSRDEKNEEKSEDFSRVKKVKSKSGAKKILIVEDDRFLRDLMVQKLENENYEVFVAVDGEMGYKKIIEIKPDMILLDLILPGINGFEVLEKMKANQDIASIPVLILSNLGQKEDIERGLTLGAKDYLIKAHFTPGEIVEKIKQNF